MDTGPFFSGSIVLPATTTRPVSNIYKAICIRVGDRNEAAVCYDTELLRVAAGWTGPFLKIDGARFGLIVPPRIAGEVVFSAPEMPGWSRAGRFDDERTNKPYGPLPREHAQYLGLHLHGNRVALNYSVGKAFVTESPWIETFDGTPIMTRTLEVSRRAEPLDVVVCGRDGVAAVVSCNEDPDELFDDVDPSKAKRIDSLCQLKESALTTVRIQPHHTTVLVKIAIASRDKLSAIRLAELTKRMKPAESLNKVRRPGPTRWNAKIETRGQRAKDEGPFAIDNLPLPFDNPYRALMFVSGHDFFENGDAAICTAHGDVWRLSGLTDDLERLTWKRFATGLFQPLGLRIVKGQVCVVGRDQITRLQDRNGDGEADFYENVNNEGQVTLNGHEYVTCLETDSHGNFYFLKGDSGSRIAHDGSLLRVSADGQKFEVFATGLRNANGLGIGPDDEISVAPQEGEWTPASGIFFVKPGGFCGAMQVHHRAEPPTDFDKPICWLPRRIDNSSGGQVWVPTGQWGPLAGQLLHFSYGQCTMMLVLRESVNDQIQGGTVTLPGKFLSGAMRGRFHPLDKHLYVSGLRGWVTNASADGCLQRVRYTGRPLTVPVRMRTYANGIALTFSEPLQPEQAEDPDAYRVEQWDYRWSAEYGSPELKPSQLGVEGRESVYVESASLLPDRKTVFLEIGKLAPVWQLGIQCRVASAGGESQLRTLYATLHNVPTEAMDVSGLTRRRSRGHLSEDERRQLVPGLLVRFDQHTQRGELHDVVRRRMAALHVDANQAPTSGLESGPFRAVFEGYLRANEPGKYRLRLTGNGAARLYLNDRLIDESNDLSKRGVSTADSTEHELLGYVRMRIEYEQKQQKAASMFRLLWKPENGPEDPIPPTALWSSSANGDFLAAQRLRHGRDALQRLRCGNCHDASTPKPIVANDGPSLANIGVRVRRDWLARWLLDPQAVRNDSSMPRLLGTADRQSARQQAADLAAFLVPDSVDSKSETFTEEKHQRLMTQGEQHWEELGCIGCHRFSRPEMADAFDRVSLHYAGLKYSHESLVDFLRQPQAHYPSTRMPDFRLSSEEAQALAVYVETNSAKQWDDDFHIPPGNAIAGRTLAMKRQCAHCHDFGPVLARNDALQPIQPLSRSGPWNSGCLAETPRDRSSPQFSLSAESLAAIRQALDSDQQFGIQPNAIDDAQKWFADLRCHVCHSRDGISSRLPELVAEEGNLGRPTESLPDLTWAGERLKAAWLGEFVGGQRRDRMRPQLRARMPAFPAYAATMAHGFAGQHGLPTVDELPSEQASRAAATYDAAIGYRLTLKDGGLDCRQCHGIGHHEPVADARTRIAPGINFVKVRDRLRHDFYKRFVLDPPRYELNTRMPKLSADGKTTVTHILDGDAPKQFDAIWSYIQTLKGDEP